MKMKLRLFFSLIMIFALAGCDKRKTGIQWMPDMVDSPTVKAQEDYLDPPANSVARNSVFYPKTAEESEKLLENPLPNTAETIAAGKVVYEIACAVCHGTAADGQGTLTEAFPKAPDLRPLKRGDGWFFHRITFGLGNMPGYAHSVTVKERWEIIHYLKTLQR